MYRGKIWRLRFTFVQSLFKLITAYSKINIVPDCQTWCTKKAKVFIASGPISATERDKTAVSCLLSQSFSLVVPVIQTGQYLGWARPVPFGRWKAKSFFSYYQRVYHSLHYSFSGCNGSYNKARVCNILIASN